MKGQRLQEQVNDNVATNHRQHAKIVGDLNRAHHEVMAGDPSGDPSVWMIGEDLLGPYGGAFKVARSPSTAFPERVLSTPISECGFTASGCGLALDGQKPIVEIMFGDFNRVVNRNGAARFMAALKQRIEQRAS